MSAWLWLAVALSADLPTELPVEPVRTFIEGECAMAVYGPDLGCEGVVIAPQLHLHYLEWETYGRTMRALYLADLAEQRRLTIAWESRATVYREHGEQLAGELLRERRARRSSFALGVAAGVLGTIGAGMAVAWMAGQIGGSE